MPKTLRTHFPIAPSTARRYSLSNDQLLAKAKALIAIESTAHRPEELRKAYDFMVDFLRGSGKKITIESFESNGKSSFLAYKGSKRPKQFHLILNGHVDVVPGNPPQYRPIVKDGKLYGRGAYDMKAACVVLADVFCEFVDKVPFALGLQVVTDEESGGRHGTWQQIQQGVRSDFVICGECGSPIGRHEIANRAKGVIVADVGLRGKSAHAAQPWNGNNAAAQAQRFVQKLHERYPIPTDATENTTLTVTGITASSGAPTKIPDRAVVSLDVRYAPNDLSLNSLAKFTALMQRLDPDAQILTLHDVSAPLYADPNHPQLRLLQAAAEKVAGATFQFAQRNGSSDGRFYGEVSAPACEFGIAGEQQHGDDEYISLKAFEEYRETLRTFLAMNAQAHEH